MTNIQPTKTPISAKLPDGNFMHSTHELTLNIPTLPKEAGRSHIFPQLKSSSLLSIGQLCDYGCSATFTKSTLTVKNNADTTILTGSRDFNTGMWIVDLAPFLSPPPQINGIIRQRTAVSDLIEYLHACNFSPVKSTWLSAIRSNFFTTWPGLTYERVSKHLHESEATAKGHLDQEMTGIQPSTPNPDSTQRTNNVMVDLQPITGKTYSDLTGRFPTISSRGNQYIFIMYDYDSNAILAEPIRNRTGPEIVRACTTLHSLLIKRGLQPKFHMLDNEASLALQAAITNNNIEFQLAPPHIHRRNAAERAIRTFKNHFIAGLCSTDSNFPMHLWCRLIPQALLTLNLLRPSRINPTLSAEAQLNGAYDFMKHPLAPPGTKCQVHEKPSQRRTWAPHSVDGWYVGPSMQHYRCYRVYIPSTHGERIADTVEFFPEKIPIPATSSLDQAKQAASDLVDLLQNPHPNSPFLNFGQDQYNALQQLADMFKVSLTYDDITQEPRVTPQQPRVPTATPTPPPRPVPRTAPRPVPCPTPTATRPQGYTGNSFDIPRPQHRYNTRSQARQRAAQANSVTTELPCVPPHLLEHHVMNPVLCPDTGRQLEYHHLIAPNASTRNDWLKGMANELGRLANGCGTRVPKGTNTIEFIPFQQVPTNKTVTYARIVSEIRPDKPDPNRVRITAGGNLIYYPQDKSTPVADITTAKLLFNSTISTPGAKFLGLDIANMYLETPLKDPEFMRMKFDLIPEEIRQQYNLYPMVHTDGYIYIKIKKGMYGLPQAGKLAHDLLKDHLAKYDFVPARFTPGLWKHKTRNIRFCLVVDDFGVKYTRKEDALFLINALKERYTIYEDWSGSKYIGITLKWDYQNRIVYLSMPGYVRKALHKFQHLWNGRRQDSPFQWTPPTYGAKVQYADDEISLPILSTDDTLRIQQIVGTFLYYARAIDNTMLPALNNISSHQSAPTAKTAAQIAQLLDYAASNPDAVVKFVASDMVLHIHSDASYLSLPKARSRMAGYFYLSDSPPDPTKPPTNPTHNGPILVECQALKHVVASAAESEFGGLFVNGKSACPVRTTLVEMGHPQPPTPICTDNNTASGIVNSSIRQKRSKAMDMRFYWIQDRTRQGHFLVYWRPGRTNLADYHTKHHPASHHRRMRPTYLHTGNSLIHPYDLQGCITLQVPKPTGILTSHCQLFSPKPSWFHSNNTLKTLLHSIDVEHKSLLTSS